MPGSTTLQFPFTGGIDQRTAAEYVDPNARLLTVNNGVFVYDGSVDRRFGVQGLTSAGLGPDPVMHTPERLVTRGQELAMIDGVNLFSYSPGGAVWARRSLVSPCVATREGSVSPAFTAHGFNQSPSVFSFSIAEGSGVRAIAYRTAGSGGANNQPGQIMIDVQDLTTDAYVFKAYTLGTGADVHPAVVIQGSYVYVFWSTNSTITGQVLNLTTMTWASSVSVVSDMLQQSANASPFDVTPYAGGSGILLAYGQNQGGYSYTRACRLEALPALTISASFYVSSTVGADITLVACRYDTALGIVVFGWEQLSGGSYSRFLGFYNTSWSAIGAATLSMPGFASSPSCGSISVEPLTSTTALVVFGGSSVSGHATYNTSGAQLQAVQHTGGVACGRPFRATVASGGSSHFNTTVTLAFLPFAFSQASTDGGTQIVTYGLLDTTAYGLGLYRNVAVVAPRQGDAFWINSNLVADGVLPSVTGIGNPSAGTYRGLVVVRGNEDLQFTSAAGVNLVTWDFTGTTNWQVAEGEDESFVSGGVASYYDGSGLAEISFFQWPTVTSHTPSSSGGSLSTGTYEYALCFAQPDSQGLVHKSAFYVLNVTTTSNTSSVALQFQNIAATGRFLGQSAPTVEIYRTQANLQTLYYVGSVYCQNTPGPVTLSYTDTSADSTIATNPLQYTTGGVVDSVCPPSLRSIKRHNERIWGVGDDGYAIWFSTEFNASDAPYFNEALTVQFSDGPLTALETMDDKLVVFSATRIWYLTGDGPALTGVGSDLSNPVVVQTDVGAIDWRSVVSTPIGIMFQSPMGGIYLLDRTLTVSYIGKAVQDIVGPTPTGASQAVIAAHLVASANHVRFVLSGGTVLFYDYVMERWGTSSYTVSPLCAAVPSSGVWTYGGSDGYVYQEKSATSSAPWYDTSSLGVNTWPTRTVASAHVKLAGVQGYQRLRHTLGYAHWLEASDQQITLTFDYGEQTQSATFTYAKLFAANAVAAQWDLHTSAMGGKAAAVQVTWSDAPPTGGTATTGQGARLLGLAFELQTLDSRYRKLAPSVKA